MVTYGRPVLSHEPQVVAEEWADADEEQGGHDEQKQDVELGVRVGQLFLEKWEEREQGCSSHQSDERSLLGKGNYCSMQIQLASVHLLFCDHMTQVRAMLTL